MRERSREPKLCVLAPTTVLLVIGLLALPVTKAHPVELQCPVNSSPLDIDDTSLCQCATFHQCMDATNRGGCTSQLSLSKNSTDIITVFPLACRTCVCRPQEIRRPKHDWPEFFVALASRFDGMQAHNVKELQAAQPDMVKDKVPFDPEYRNPCWTSPVTKQRECMPLVYLIGMPKCGTTDLYSKLTLHPNIIPAELKEPQFWAKRQLTNIGQLSTFKYYVSRYSRAARTVQHAPNLTVTIDASPSTMWYFVATSLLSPFILTPELLHHMVPMAKLLVVLRDPTERLYSDYMYFDESSPSPQAFHEYALQAVQHMDNCIVDFSSSACAWLWRTYSGFEKAVRLDLGMYVEFIKIWLRFFPRNALLVVTTEDLGNSDALKNILEHLGVPDDQAVTMNLDAQRENVGMNKQKLGDMLPETRRLLRRFYQPYNDQLATLLRDTRFAWR